MKAPICSPARISRLASSGATLLSALLLLTGCVSSKYHAAKEGTPPPQVLNVAFAPAPLEAALNTVITYNGPGSWKRNAFWDEYVVTLRNPGPQRINVSGAALVDLAGTPHLPGSQPWALEKESKTLEQKYKDVGIAFVRYTAPGVLIAGVAVGAVVAEGGIMAGGAAIGSTIAIAALPLYYIGVVYINHNNKVAMEKEFARRHLNLPLTLAPGETRTCSLFFPMIPSPRSLGLHWTNGPDSGDAVLPLEFLHELHLKPPAAAPAR